jgi:hypothetical protein
MSPITPQQVAAKKERYIPKAVFDVFDALIVENFCAGKAVVKQKDVVERVKKTLPDFKSAWLNVEEAYEAIGWQVYYDKPAYNETYDATFVFQSREKRGGDGVPA